MLLIYALIYVAACLGIIVLTGWVAGLFYQGE